MDLEQYKKALAEGKKICYYCGKNGHARKHKIFTHNYQRYFWVCRPCLEIKGVGNVVSELEKIPMSLKQTNFYKKNKGETK